MNKGFFITGTDTGVGKTVITGAIIKALHSIGINACAAKPVETGCHRDGNILYPSDGMFLKRVARMDESINHITPYCFETPAAPSVASDMEGKAVDIPAIIGEFNSLLETYQAIVVEGVGGILVPIMSDYFVIDLIRELGLPLIVVSRPSLGTINHTLLTVNYALKEGIEVSGIIINFSRPAEGTIAEKTNPALLEQISPVPVIGVFPYLDDLGDETLRKAALKHLNIEIIRANLSKP
ncbi:MAG: dethiobiotin synthase [Thermodesulfovibrionales bacterium]